MRLSPLISASSFFLVHFIEWSISHKTRQNDYRCLDVQNKLKLKMGMSSWLFWFGSRVKWSNLISGRKCIFLFYQNQIKSEMVSSWTQTQYYIFSVQRIFPSGFVSFVAYCPLFLLLSKHANTLLIGPKEETLQNVFHTRIQPKLIQSKRYKWDRNTLHLIRKRRSFESRKRAIE